ncbi:MAG: peptide/nickel transport system substrate-binding protein [Solirubrobacteraceae bacterium]
MRMGHAIAVVLVLVAALVAGCGGGGKAVGTSDKAGKTASAVGDTLNLAVARPPNSLNPAFTNTSWAWYVHLAYDPLIIWGPDGKPKPSLATSWRYVGNGNKTFELTLRPNVKFSDGSALTAKVVKDNLDYQKQAGGPYQPFVAGKTITATGPLTVRITTKLPDPEIVRELSQDLMAGNMISPKGLANPKGLGTTTAGAGPYVLQPEATVPGDHYTYTPNPNYWNKAAIHYRKVVVKALPNPNSVLNALKTGQVDAAIGDYTTAATAESAGLQVKSAPFVFLGLNLMDRKGKIVPALGDVRVRQALNYAVDRKTISQALLGKFGTPTEQTVVPGQDGALTEPVYTYDPAKAKQLLAQAGYAKGLTIPVLTTTYSSQDQVTQAIAGDLEKVGVKLKIKVEANVDKYTSDMIAAKYPAASMGIGALPIYIESPLMFFPTAAVFNPFKAADAKVQSLWAQAAAADPGQREALDQQLERRIVELGWFVPVMLSPKFYYARTNVTGIAPTVDQPKPNPVWFQPAE